MTKYETDLETLKTLWNNYTTSEPYTPTKHETRETVTDHLELMFNNHKGLSMTLLARELDTTLAKIRYARNPEYFAAKETN